MSRPMTQQDLKAAFDAIAPVVVRLFNEERRVAPQLFVLTMGPEGLLERMSPVDPVLVSRMHGSNAGKDSLMALVALLLADDSPVRRQLIEKGHPRPDVVVHVSEAWIAREELRDAQGRLIPPSERADREEAIVLTLHTAFGSNVQCIRVDARTRKAPLTPAFDPLVQTWSGRMQLADWLPRGQRTDA